VRTLKPAKFHVRSYIVDEDGKQRRFWKFDIIAHNARKLDPRQPYNSKAAAVKACRAIMEAKEIVFK
jgi:hypothetical protein